MQSSILNNKEKIKKIGKELDQFKAENVICLDVSEFSSYTDLIFMCTANSLTHIKAMVLHMQDFLQEIDLPLFNKNKRDDAGGWMIIDGGDVLIHVLLEDERKYYNLEGIFEEAKEIAL